MLRRAVIQSLKAILELNGRVYQAFLVPAHALRPYATVKAPVSRGTPGFSYGGVQPLEVRIYDDQTSFDGLDVLERAVTDKLHGREITDQNDGERYFVQWVPGGGDFIDEEKRLIGRLLVFEAALLHEPGGG